MAKQKPQRPKAPKKVVEGVFDQEADHDKAVASAPVDGPVDGPSEKAKERSAGAPAAQPANETPAEPAREKPAAQPETEGTNPQSPESAKPPVKGRTADHQSAMAPHAETADADAGQPQAPTQPWKRFAFRAPKITVGALIAALLAGGLGFATMTQVQQTERSGLKALSQGELVALLANVNDQATRLGKELDGLRQQKARLSSGSDSQAVADAQKQLDQLAILNGTAPVTGPGITIDISKAEGVTAANVLDAVEELRDAGAESIDVGGNRVVEETWFSDKDGKVTVMGKPLPEDYVITAIGDSHTMSTAMAIPGGVTDTLTQAGAEVKVSEKTDVRISSVRPSRN